MTPSSAKELLPIIKAFSEGKPIEFFLETENKWYPLETTALFDASPEYYRIAKELPKYRVFQYTRHLKPVAVCTSSSKDKDYLKRLEDVESAGNGVWVTDWIECSNIKD